MRKIYLLVLMLCFCSCPILAADKPQVQGQQKTAPSLTKSQAANIAAQKYGGKILKIQRQSQQGRSGYKIKLLQNSGHVKSVWVDAGSGAIH